MSTAKSAVKGPSTCGYNGTGDRVQMREYWLPKLVSAGSNPVTRSMMSHGPLGPVFHALRPKQKRVTLAALCSTGDLLLDLLP